MSVEYASPVCAPIMKRYGNKEVCLCLHGYCGSPGFYLPLADMIKEAGYDQCAPLLSGHGTQPSDMLEVKAEQWLDDVCRTMEQLMQEYDKVHMLGASMGGALCTYLAARYADSGKVGKVMMLVPGYGMKSKHFYTLDYENCGEDGFPLVQSADVPPELVETSYLYNFMYQKSIGQLIRLSAMCAAEIDNVTAPVWVLYSKADPVADPELCADAARRFKGLVRCHAYEKSGHNLLIDCEREDVYRKIEAFLKA